MALHFSRNPPAPAPSTLAYFPPDCPRESRLRFWVAACAAAAGYSLHVLEESLCWPDTDAAHDEVTAAIIGLQAETRGGVLHGSSTGGVSVILRDLPRGDAPDRGTAADLELPEDCELLVEWLSRQRPAMERGQQLAGPGLVVCHLGEGPCGDLDWPVLSWGLTLLLSGPGRGVLIDAQHTAGGLSWALSGQLFGDDDRWPRPDWASERRVAKD